MLFIWCPLTYVPFFVFFLPLSNTPSLSLSFPRTSLSLSTSVLCFLFLFFFTLSHWPPSVWLGRASPLMSWLPCPSGQPWRRPMGPLPCLTPACSSTNRPWPACSFSSRLLSSHQVWPPKQPPLVLWPPRGCLDQSNLAPAWAGGGQSGRFSTEQFGCGLCLQIEGTYKNSKT